MGSIFINQYQKGVIFPQRPAIVLAFFHLTKKEVSQWQMKK